MKCTRRQLFTAHWQPQADEQPHLLQEESDQGRMTQLPSDFSPALILAQAKLLNLDVENMTREEMAQAVLNALNAQRPEGATEKEEA